MNQIILAILHHWFKVGSEHVCSISALYTSLILEFLDYVVCSVTTEDLKL